MKPIDPTDHHGFTTDLRRLRIISAMALCHLNDAKWLPPEFHADVTDLTQRLKLITDRLNLIVARNIASTPTT